MRVLVMGTGGVGGLCGALLAMRGNEVTFVARGPHLAALRERGLELRCRGQVDLIHPVHAVADPAEAPADSGAGAVHRQDLRHRGALQAVRPAIGPGTAVLTLQNGVESADDLSAALGADHVLVGTALVFAAIVEPGVIEAGPLRRLTIGEPSGARSPALRRSPRCSARPAWKST